MPSEAKGIGSPGAGAERSAMGFGDLGPLQDQYMFLTVEPSLLALSNYILTLT